jgi:SAM-dependent methyltransferase
MDTTIQLASQWAEDLWKQVADNWRLRKQDLNYRTYVARPGLEEAFKGFWPVKNGIFIDFGCGDGRETQFIQALLENFGNGGIFYGFDFQKSLIRMAETLKQKDQNRVFLNFDFGNTEDLLEKYNLYRKVDRIFSTFLLQDLPDIHGHLETCNSCLKKEGGGIFLLLHPEFGKMMLKKGVIKRNPGLRSSSWRWAGKYPIVEEEGRTFYVPYFHRSVEDYLALMRRYFSVRYLEFIPSERIVREAPAKKISPFYDHPGNLYYPEIIKIPSSLFLIFTK